MQPVGLPFTLSNLDDGCLVAGVDEAGRGPLAGDVVAAAVILDPARPISGLADSKMLSAVRREKLFTAIQAQAVAYAVARASVEEIDSINILHASMLAMHRAVSALVPAPGFVYVDGNRCPDWHWRSEAVVKGDNRVAAIAAASILAKVTRDHDMSVLDMKFPGYGLANHKGYPTKAHIEALQRLGPTPVHRRSYAPVARLLREQGGRSGDSG